MDKQTSISADVASGLSSARIVTHWIFRPPSRPRNPEAPDWDCAGHLGEDQVLDDSCWYVSVRCVHHPEFLPHSRKSPLNLLGWKMVLGRAEAMDDGGEAR